MSKYVSIKNNPHFKQRYKIKKWLNIALSSIIFVLGFTSLTVSLLDDLQGDFLSGFRYMTVIGTVYTTTISLIMVFINLTELWRGEEYVFDTLYFIRLSSAVTESIIAIVIALSLFPFIPDNPNILKYDSFNMHVIIPILSITSFLIHDRPIENMKPIMRLHGAWLITVYAVVLITLIFFEFIPQEQIPYSFLEVKTRPLWYVLLAGFIVYASAYVLSWAFSAWNKKLSWLWFKDI